MDNPGRDLPKFIVALSLTAFLCGMFGGLVTMKVCRLLSQHMKLVRVR